MADYQSLIQRAVGGLSEPKAAARRAVYDRARAALIDQLRGLDSPLPESDVARERLALDEAIARVEEGFPAEADPEPEPPAPAPPPPIAAEPSRPAEPPALRAQPDWSGSPPAGEPAPAEGEAARPRERPRVETVRPSLARAGRWRPAVLAVGIAVPVLGIALVAFLNRPDPAALPQRPTVGEGATAEGDAKLADRVAGSERAPREAAPSSPLSPPPGPGAATAPPRSDAPAAQRAILYEENPAQPQQPRASGGRATWRLDNVNAGQGQPLETVVRTTVDVPDAGMTLTMLIRRNTEATLPASHTVELTFSATAGQGRTVRDVGLLQLKNGEGTRGTPVAGVPVPVRDNLFLIGLSNLPGDIERNTELLTRRSWLDLPIRFTTGQRAILSFEKGASGESVLNEAFRLWR
jgi:hypothetical protein